MTETDRRTDNLAERQERYADEQRGKRGRHLSAILQRGEMRARARQVR